MVNILIGVSGSVAAIKLTELVRTLKDGVENVKIQIVFTPKGKFFITDAQMLEINSMIEAVHTDEHEWLSWKQKGDKVLHVELRKWAQILLIAPLSANSMAKISNGLCDNLLTSVVRAWDPSRRLIVCPAMNTFMWRNKLTSRQLDVIKDVYNAQVVMPKEDYILACGDIGPGAMGEVSVIVEAVLMSVSYWNNVPVIYRIRATKISHFEKIYAFFTFRHTNTVLGSCHIDRW